MSKLSQRDAMINYFNSLLSEELEDEQEQNLSSKKNLEVSPSTEPVLQPKLQDEEVVQAKPFAEKPNKKQALQALLTAALPDTRTETATVTDTVTDTAIATEDKTQVETVVENKVETEQQTEVAIDTATKEEVITQEATVTEVATAQETTTETATEQTVQTTTNVTEVVDTAIATTTDTLVSHVEVQAPVVEEQVTVATAPTPVWQNIETKEEFTALFFKVAGVTFAVPLINLGGIYEPGNITSIFGKPAWYMGLMQLGDRKISVVDTQKWMLPDIPSVKNREYKYIIMLDKSDWCIGCDELIGTKNITRSAVKWRATPGARPWLAGIVKDEMCVLIHVMELIKLYQNGLDMCKE